MNKPKEYDCFIKKLKKVKIVKAYDIPYFAGYNWTGNKVYIDREIPKYLKIDNKRLDLHTCLAIHEFTEKQYINRGYTYSGAHRIATGYEKYYVLSKKLAWEEYDKIVGKLIHKNFLDILTLVPRDLDMTPYEYSRDVKTLSKMRKLLNKNKF